MDILEMMAKAASRQNEEDKPTPLPEAQVARLREMITAYSATTCPFKVGDLVTPRRDSPLKGTGVPHAVVATRDADYDWDCGESGDITFGMRFDMRVISVQQESIVPHWVESAGFERYVGSGSDAA